MPNVIENQKAVLVWKKTIDNVTLATRPTNINLFCSHQSMPSETVMVNVDLAAEGNVASCLFADSSN